MNRKHVLLINYTGKRGGGALDAYEMTRALINNGNRVIAVVSKEIENLALWEALRLEKLIVIDTYTNNISFLLNSLLFIFKQAKYIKTECAPYIVDAIYCPMITYWTEAINDLFSNSIIAAVNHDPIPHTGATFMPIAVKRVCKKSDLVIVHTKSFVPLISNKYRRVCYLPLGPHNMYKNIENKINAIEYDNSKVNFLFFGRISKYKGLDDLARAYSILYDKFPDRIALTIVGNGNFEPYYELYKGLSNVTIINRWIKDEEVESIFDAPSLVCICPYKDATQSGVVLVAFDYGIPVIATKTGGLVEQIENNSTGFLVEPNNPNELAYRMGLFITDSELHSRMSTEISEHMNSISWEHSGIELNKLLLDQLASDKEDEIPWIKNFNEE